MGYAELLNPRKHGVTASLVGMVAVAGIVSATSFAENLGVIDGFGADGGIGTVTDIRPVDVRPQCNTAVDVDMENVHTKFERKLKLFSWSVGVQYKQENEFNGVITSKVCRASGKATVKREGQDGCEKKLCVTMPDDIYSAEVYVKNPYKDMPRKIDTGITKGLATQLETIAQSMPYVKTDGFEGGAGIDALMTNYTLMVAYSGATKCVKEAAWPGVSKVEVAQEQQTFAEYGKIWTGEDIKPEDIKINVPKTIKTLDDQYDRETLAEVAGVKGMSLTAGTPTKCALSKELQQRMGELGVSPNA